MENKYKERNIDITLKVLEGISLAVVAKEYDLSPARLGGWWGIVNKTCKKYFLPKEHIYLRNTSLDGVEYRLKTLRKYYKEGILVNPYKIDRIRLERERERKRLSFSSIVEEMNTVLCC